MNLPDLNDMEIIHAYLDNRLDPEVHAAFEVRLLEEPSLAAAFALERGLRSDLRARLRQTHAPVKLHVDVRAALAGAETKQSFGQRWIALLSTPWPLRPYVAIVYTLVLFVIFGGIVFWSNRFFSSGEDHSVFRQFAGKHAVYLQAALSLDVRGEPDDIAAWLQERVSFPVSVPTLPDWILEGGRLGEFHHQAIAHLIYDRAGQHVSLTLFVPLETDFPGGARKRLDGTDFFVGTDDQQTVILWRIGDVGYALVGDPSLPTAELLSIAISLNSQLH
jgi:anti-sigma factor RsiW